MKKLTPVLWLIVRVLVILLVAVTFFLGYSRFLVDNSLNDLKLALNNIKNNELAGVDKMLSYAVSEELQKLPPEVYTTIALEYSKDVLKQKTEERPVADVERMVESVIQKKQEQRGKLLTMLDSVGEKVTQKLHLQKPLPDRVAEKEKAVGAEPDLTTISSKEPIIEEYQKASSLKQEGKHEEAVQAYLDMAKQYENFDIAPLLIYQSAATYKFDLKNEDKAEELMMKLRKEYPAAHIAEVKKVEVPGHIKLIEKAAGEIGVKIAEIMIMIATDYVQRGLSRGNNMVHLRPTDERITLEIKKRINSLVKNSPMKLDDIKLTFEPGSRINIKSSGRTGFIRVNVNVTGKMTLEKHMPETVNTITGMESEKMRWIQFKLEEVRVNDFNVDPEMMNRAIAEAHKVFNRNLPFDVQTFRIEEGAHRMVWMGPARRVTSSLRGGGMANDRASRNRGRR